MLKIATHIEQLLLTNDCVIIPDFGGFVLHTCPAIYESKEHSFYPSHKEIVFNPTLNYNDGLFIESYMLMYGLDNKEAHNLLKKDIDELKKELNRRGDIQLGKVGTFQKNVAGGLIFQPGKDVLFFSGNSYGLVSFNLPAIRFEQSESKVVQNIKSKNKPKQVIYFPINRTLIHLVGTTAAVIGLFLLISTPVRDVNHASYTASFIPSEMFPKGIFAEVVAVDFNQEFSSEVYYTNESTLPIQEIITNPIIEELQPISKVERLKAYYVIIGSFNSENQAGQFIKEINMPDLKNIGIVKSNENIRVYANKFGNKKEAEKYIQLLRVNEKFKNSWLFIDR